MVSEWGQTHLVQSSVIMKNGEEDITNMREQPTLTTALRSRSYDEWDKETSTNDCDIWNEIQNHESSYPINTSRINKAENRQNAIKHLRRSRRDSRTSSSVGVGTNPMEGAELDDDSSDDDLDFLQAQNTSVGEPSSREFLREMGISEESEKKLFDLFKISEDEVSVPPTISHKPKIDAAKNEDIELPKPLFSKEQCEGAEVDDTQLDDDEEDAEIERTAPRFPVEDNTPSITICPNREDDCSLRVYIDESYLNFPLIKQEANHNEDGDDCDH